MNQRTATVASSLALVLTACAGQAGAAVGTVAPQYALTDSAATQAVAQRQLADTQVAATATAQIKADQLFALSLEQTRTAMTLTAAPLTATPAARDTSVAATAVAAPAETATAAIAGTPTAIARRTEVAATATALAVRSDMETKFSAGLALVCLGALIGLSIVAGFVVHSIGAAASARIEAEAQGRRDKMNIEAEAEAEARKMKAEAEADRIRAEANEIAMRTMRNTMVRIGPFIIHFTPDGPVVFKTVEELPAPGTGSEIEDLDPLAGTIARNDANGAPIEPLARLSSGQARLARFTKVCVDLNGPASNVVPTADRLEERGVDRDERQKVVNILKGLKLARTQRGQSGGTWLTGEYQDLGALHQAALLGRIPVPDFQEDR